METNLISERAKNWLEEAIWDFDNAKILLKNDRFNTAVFLSQQAAEKAVKALLFQQKINGWGHSIYTLLEKYRTLKNINITNLVNDALSLDKHHIITRYPDALPDIPPHKAYNKQEADTAIELAINIISFAKKEMGKIG